MMYVFSYHEKAQIDVDMTSRGLFGWYRLLRFRVGMYIAGWSWKVKADAQQQKEML